LRGQVTTRYWTSIVGAPVTADARQVVARGGADLVCVPSRGAAGLIEVADLGTFTELSIAVRGGKLGEVSKAIQGAVRSSLGGAWKDGAPRFPAAVELTTLQIVSAQVTAVSFLELLAHTRREPPNLSIDEMWVEPDAQ
jgi:hypothetical protein